MRSSSATRAIPDVLSYTCPVVVTHSACCGLTHPLCHSVRANPELVTRLVVATHPTPTHHHYHHHHRTSPELRARLMQNMSAQDRLRVAIRAGNQTALVELCLHLHDQVQCLTQRRPRAKRSQASQSPPCLSAACCERGRGETTAETVWERQQRSLHRGCESDANNGVLCSTVSDPAATFAWKVLNPT
jgi:hypothetical protein